jgi:hypothetical protein
MRYVLEKATQRQGRSQNDRSAMVLEHRELKFLGDFFVLLLQKRVDDEIRQLLIDIRRIGEPGSPEVKFGELFDDDEAQQYYEALVGTLKSAKKRGVIDFKGQMLLKGMHDNVVISIKQEALTPVQA